ncbi:MAG: hypothetical protein M1814_003868 [Vezdaea aestivalis]|nr:MAG: hypothetical protein M1814_003868 [Vezdaea aestivalis]
MSFLFSAMASALDWIGSWIRTKPLVPLSFPTEGFEAIPDNYIVEEESLSSFKDGNYYPVNIGDVLAFKYQVLGKLGYGTTSTVWLALDLHLHRYVTLKVFTRDASYQTEVEVSRVLVENKPPYRGQTLVRTMLDLVMLPRASGDHACMIQTPMWDNYEGILSMNPERRFPKELLQMLLKQLFVALDYLHTECKYVHTDISSHNIFMAFEDDASYEQFVKDEMENPTDRKFAGDMTIYLSKALTRTEKGGIGLTYLGDFGHAVRGDEERNNDCQPDCYRSPEVWLEINWSYPIDIWNVGVMIWDVFQGKHMFHGQDPDGSGYKTRAHLTEVIGMIGMPPLDLVQRGNRSPEFFTDEGQFKPDIEIKKTSLEESEERLEGEDKELFMDFLRGMLQWRPEDRKTTRQLLHHPWLEYREIQEARIPFDLRKWGLIEGVWGSLREQLKA